jgi:hypothetical protein
MRYPDLLLPTTIEVIELPSKVTVQIPKTEPTFDLWKGKPISDTYGNKTVLDCDGEPTSAELAILRIFEKDGWQGVWVDSYRNKFRKDYPAKSVALPPEQQRLLSEIYEKAGSNKACWDVFCWKDDGAQLFAESKRQGRDRMRDTQCCWLEAAINCGLPTSAFLIVEWKAGDLADVSRFTDHASRSRTTK